MRFDIKEFKYIIKFYFSFGIFRYMINDANDLCFLLINGFFGLFLNIMIYLLSPISILVAFLTAIKLNRR